jgi:sigma-B regulation protein RsbU (phosphoserine phosphatase)
MNTSITSKLIVVLTLCLAAILALGMTIDYLFSRDEILERVRLESAETVNNVVSELEQWLHGVEGDTLFLARVLEQREYSREGLNQLLRDIVTHNEEIFGAAIALNPELTDKPQGFAPYFYHRKGAINFTDFADKNQKYWEHAWYSDAAISGKPIWVEPYFDEDGGEVLMTTFSVPVYHFGPGGNRSLYAVVTADVALTELHRYLQQLHLGENGYGVLISKAGIVLSTARPDSIMHHYLDVMSTPTDSDTWKRSFNAALAGETLVFPIECPARFGKCNARLSTLKATGWPVGFIYSQDEVLAPLREYETKTAIVGLGTLLLMALTVGIVSRRLTGPLVALARASDTIATGDLNAPLPRVNGKDEVARLVQSFGAMKRDLKSYISDLEIATAGKARLEGELAAATQIQMSMLPQGGEALEESDSYSLWAKVRPAKSVGGDLYTFYQCDENNLYLAVGDVSDKGVPAALFMAKAISHIKQYEEAFGSPPEGMALLNNALEEGNDNCMFVTLFFGVLDLQTLELRFSSAGHTAPSLLRDGVTTVVSQDTGPALGLIADMSYPENTLSLAPGDRLAIYTDGIDEAFNGRAEMFGFERMNTQLQASSKEKITAAGTGIFRCVDDFAGDTPQSDDITLMLLDIPGQPPNVQKTSRSFDCDSSAFGAVAAWLEEVFQQMPVDDAACIELTLVSEEILTNIHKYAELPAGTLIEVSIGIDANHITLEFSDEGIAFNPFLDGHRAILGEDIESAEIGGLGVHLITQLTDGQSYQRINGRNLLTVEKFLSGA